MTGPHHDHKTLLAALPPEARQELTRKSDRRGLLHLAGHLGLIAVLGTWVGLGLPFWPLAIWPLGIALAFLFTLQHECTHATPFRSGWLNTAAGLVAGAVLVQPFYWFRLFHLAHHRHTNDPDRDPELQGDAKPESWSALLWHLSTLGYWAGKLRVLSALALGRADDDYIPPKARPRIIAEARLLGLFYAGAAVFTAVVSPVLVWVWLIPLASGFPVLRLYLLAEHGRCPAVANMFVNTRTTLTNRLVRYLAWNMPYHAEHHAYPAVPFHKLPAFHAHTRAALTSVSPGYRSFTSDYVAGFGAPRTD
ncbi:MAG: fatty acid desaturase [Pseudomonadota bacterium]